jgi:hypothetical protein
MWSANHDKLKTFQMELRTLKFVQFYVVIRLCRTLQQRVFFNADKFSLLQNIQLQ